MNLPSVARRLALLFVFLPSALAAEEPADILRQALPGEYTGYDRNDDGTEEIHSLSPMAFEAEDEAVGAEQALVVVFVEDRLLKELEGAAHSAGDVRQRLARLKEDLERDGYRSRFYLADVYGGERHQDGRTVLAMRDFLRDVAEGHDLRGALLIGSFPDATLVRRWLWKRGARGVEIGGEKLEGGAYLRVVPEMVDARADIVLGDLDGNWEDIYVEARTGLDSFTAAPAEDLGEDWFRDGEFRSALFDHGKEAFEDFFWIRDDQFTDLEIGGGELKMNIQVALSDGELSESDRRLANPLAHPEIHISRINPLHIALNPDPDLKGADGETLLDEKGKPRPVKRDKGGVEWVRDEDLERKLLVEYLDRNHAYRTGEWAGLPFRAGAIGAEDFSVHLLGRYVDEARSDFEPILKAPNHADLVEYVNWLKEPAVLRALMAHSTPWNTQYEKHYSGEELEKAAGGRPWRWTREGDELKPSFKEQSGHADLYLHRTLWENGVLADAGPSFIIHAGCKVNTPNLEGRHDYTHRKYGNWQNAEGQLFYLNGLAMIARAKVFYDRPRGIAEAFSASDSPFGSLWFQTFQEDAADKRLAQDYAGNKRAYNWSVLGDWTLRLRY